jgi:hypothetical protein
MGRTHPFLIRIHEGALEQAVSLPVEGYAKALIGAVVRGVLTKEEALNIIEDANTFMLEGAASITNPD